MTNSNLPILGDMKFCLPQDLSVYTVVMRAALGGMSPRKVAIPPAVIWAGLR